MTMMEEALPKVGQEETEDMVSMLQKILLKMEMLDARLELMERKRQMARLERLREEDSFFTYVDSFVSIVNQLEVSEEDKVAWFMEGLKEDNTKLISVLKPNTLHQAITYARVLTAEENPYVSREWSNDWIIKCSEPNSNEDIVEGLDQQVTEVKEEFECPIEQLEVLEHPGVIQTLDVLLDELSRTGKTGLIEVSFHPIGGVSVKVLYDSELIRKFTGKESRRGGELFVLAKEYTPSIIFMDEIDRVGAARMKFRSGNEDKDVLGTMLELLNQLGGSEASNKIKSLVATNCMDNLDKVLLRSGQTDIKIEIPNSNKEFRVEILKIYSGRMKGVRRIARTMQGKGFEALYGYSPPTWSNNFIFSGDDVGKNRTVASIQKLQELKLRFEQTVKEVSDKNQGTNLYIKNLDDSIDDDKLKELFSPFGTVTSCKVMRDPNGVSRGFGFVAFSTAEEANRAAVIFTDTSQEKAVEFNDHCHHHQPPISFIKAEVRGRYGSVFSYFGLEFMTADVDGKDPHTGIIASISNDNTSQVSCAEDEMLEFQDGNLVVCSEVKGMAELIDGKPRKVKSARPYSFILEEDIFKFSIYDRGGIVTKVKQSKVLNFKPLREVLKDPGSLLLGDFFKLDRPPLLHLAFQALDKFVTELRRYPAPASKDDAQRLISTASNINETLVDGKLEDINSRLMRYFAFGSRAVLNHMVAMFGGIVGQEIVKACSGKFHPLFQFFYFDSVESLSMEPLDSSEFKPLNSCYDAKRFVLDSTLQKKMENVNVFSVGSGSRVLAIVKILTDSFGKEHRHTMNASGCVAMECALGYGTLNVEDEVSGSGNKKVQGKTETKVGFSKKVKEIRLLVSQPTNGSLSKGDPQATLEEEIEMVLRDPIKEETKDKRDAVELHKSLNIRQVTAVQWQGCDPPTTTWEFLLELQKKYPYCTLGDKGAAEGEVLLRELMRERKQHKGKRRGKEESTSAD